MPFFLERERKRGRETKEAGDIQGLSADNAYRQCCVLREAKEDLQFEIGTAKRFARVFPHGKERQTTEAGFMFINFCRTRM